MNASSACRSLNTNKLRTEKSVLQNQVLRSCLSKQGEDSRRSALPLIGNSSLARLMCSELELKLDTDPNVSLFVQGLSEHPELSALQTVSWKKQKKKPLLGGFLFFFTCSWARNTSKIDFSCDIWSFLTLVPARDCRDGYLRGQRFKRSQFSYSHQNKWPAFQKRSYHWKGTQPGVP